jgi:hypothetical protein
MFPTTPVIDAFDRADEDPITGWTQVQGTGRIGIVSNQAKRTLLTSPKITKNGIALSDVQEAYVKIGAVAGAGSLWVLVLGTGDTFYTAAVTNAAPWICRLAAYLGGIEFVLGSDAAIDAPQTGDIFGVRFNRGLLQAFMNGNLINQVTDTQIVTGQQIGFGLGSSVWTVEEFGGGNYSLEEIQVNGTFNFRIRVG